MGAQPPNQIGNVLSIAGPVRLVDLAADRTAGTLAGTGERLVRDLAGPLVDVLELDGVPTAKRALAERLVRFRTRGRGSVFGAGLPRLGAGRGTGTNMVTPV
jgi:hypothetical protein